MPAAPPSPPWRRQAFYVDCTFVADEALHSAEGVAWAGVAVPQEADEMIALLTKPPAGLFPTLDSISRTPQATDATFCTQARSWNMRRPTLSDDSAPAASLDSSDGSARADAPWSAAYGQLGGSPWPQQPGSGRPKDASLRFHSCRQLFQIHKGHSKLGTATRIGLSESEGFELRHFAGDVCYTATGFAHTNTERLSPELEAAIYGPPGSAARHGEPAPPRTAASNRRGRRAP